MIPFKVFEKLCDLQVQDSKGQTRESEQSVTEVQDKAGWPWAASETQISDWNDLCGRLDAHVAFNKG